LVQLKQYRQVIDHLQRAASLSKKPESFLTDIALAKIAIGETEAALEELKTAVENGGYEIRTGILLAYTQMSNGKIAEAKSAAHLVLEKAPDNPTLHNLLGMLAAAKGNIIEARKSFMTSLEFDPTYTPALMNLVKFDTKIGKLENAKTRLDNLLKVELDSREAMADLAQLPEMKGNSETPPFSWKSYG